MTETRVKPARAKAKKPRLTGVKKRCRHSPKDWDLCGCQFHYYVTHEGKKYRGIIPDVSSLAEAYTAYALIAARVRAGQPALLPKVRQDEMTVEALGIDWLLMPRDRKNSTIQFYQDHLRKHVNPKLGTRGLSSITGDDLEQFIVGLTASDGTKRGIARTLHALFAFAVVKRRRADNPAAGLLRAIKDPDVSRDDVVIDPKDHTKYFTADEAQHLLATCEKEYPDWYAFVLTGLQTGMRLGELRGLRFDRINWHGGYITVDKNFVRGSWTSPKNGKQRTVSMSRKLRGELRKLRFRRRTELAFASREGTPLAISRIDAFWTKLLDAAKLGHRTRHAMRHTHTSLLLQNGVPPAKVAAEAGRSVEETMRTYAHFLPGGNREDAEVLAGLLLGRQDTVSAKRGVSGSERPRAAANG